MADTVRAALTQIKWTGDKESMIQVHVDKAREGFSAACASEESDEANDIKYKSYVILGNLSHDVASWLQLRHKADALSGP